jgi:hypothetical protein
MNEPDSDEALIDACYEQALIEHSVESVSTMK